MESRARPLILYIFGNGPIVLDGNKVELVRHIVIAIICSDVT